MAARLDPKHDARTRAKIQTSQLINRLTSFVNGEVKMEAPQVTAALGLLKKTLPDLQSLHMTPAKESESHDEWLRKISGHVDDTGSGALETDERLSLLQQELPEDTDEAG